MSGLFDKGAIEEINQKKGQWQEEAFEPGTPLKKIIDFMSGAN